MPGDEDGNNFPEDLVVGQKYATVHGITDEDNDYDRKRTQVLEELLF